MNMEDYKSSIDIPWYHKPYIRYSKRVRDNMIVDRKASTKKWEAILERNLREVESGEDDSKQMLKVIEYIRSDFLDETSFWDWIEERDREGYFVDDALCNEAGITIDLPQYYADQAEQNEQQVEQFRQLLASEQCNTDKEKQLVQDEIIKFERFAKANRRKAKTGYPNEKEILKTLLRRNNE